MAKTSRHPEAKPKDPSHSFRMTDSSKIQEIINELEKYNDMPQIELNYTNPFTLLIAVLLSAQATDKHVNKVTAPIFEDIKHPQDVLDLELDNLTQAVNSVNYYKTKAKNIYALSQKLMDEFGGEVPKTREELRSLPGIGRKSANAILNTLYDMPYMAVDTHVFRVTQRLGICKGKTPEVIEKQLEEIIPDQYKTKISDWFVLHGRYICKAKSPSCEKCHLKEWCDYYKKIIV